MVENGYRCSLLHFPCHRIASKSPWSMAKGMRERQINGTTAHIYPSFTCHWLYIRGMKLSIYTKSHMYARVRRRINTIEILWAGVYADLTHFPFHLRFSDIRQTNHLNMLIGNSYSLMMTKNFSCSHPSSFSISLFAITRVVRFLQRHTHTVFVRLNR